MQPKRPPVVPAPRARPQADPGPRAIPCPRQGCPGQGIANGTAITAVTAITSGIATAIALGRTDCLAEQWESRLLLNERSYRGYS